jgi:hypothetical protein
MSELATALWVRWPGGKETSARLPKDAREVELDSTGELKVIK